VLIGIGTGLKDLERVARGNWNTKYKMRKRAAHKCAMVSKRVGVMPPRPTANVVRPGNVKHSDVVKVVYGHNPGCVGRVKWMSPSRKSVIVVPKKKSDKQYARMQSCMVVAEAKGDEVCATVNAERRLPTGIGKEGQSKVASTHWMASRVSDVEVATPSGLEELAAWPAKPWVRKIATRNEEQELAAYRLTEIMKKEELAVPLAMVCCRLVKYHVGSNVDLAPYVAAGMKAAVLQELRALSEGVDTVESV
jgi:hypothetical protein